MSRARKINRWDRRYWRKDQQITRAIARKLRRNVVSVSVLEICREAGIKSVKTFYNHYRGVNQAVTQIEAAANARFRENIAALDEMSPRRIFLEILRFVQQNKDIFIAATKRRHLVVFENLFREAYPLLSKGFPDYGAVANQQIFWLYTGQNTAIIVAWVEQTGCDREQLELCLDKLEEAHRQAKVYFRRVSYVPYRGARLDAETLPEGLRRKTKNKTTHK